MGKEYGQNQNKINIWKRAVVSSLKALPARVLKCEPGEGGGCMCGC